MNKRLLPIAAALAVTTLSGCAALGKSDFSCPGLPNGVTCMSAIEVYHKTESHGGYDKNTMQGTQNQSGADPANQEIHGKFDSSHNHNVAITPTKPVPVLTEPEVLRIFFAPWEDENEILDAGGYVFTELRDRKWNIGVQAPMSTTRSLESLFGQNSNN